MIVLLSNKQIKILDTVKCKDFFTQKINWKKVKLKKCSGFFAILCTKLKKVDLQMFAKNGLQFSILQTVNDLTKPLLGYVYI